MKKSLLSRAWLGLYLLFSLMASAIGYSSWDILNGGAGKMASKTIVPPVACYMYNSKTSYFTTIESAVSAAKKETTSDAIEVKALVSAKEITIASSFEIPSNMTLTIPYSDSEQSDSVLYKAVANGNMNGTKTYDSLNGEPSPKVANVYSAHCKANLIVTLNKGVKITNNGKLLIGGIQHGSNGGSIAGFTTTCAKIVLSEGSSIENYGTFVNFGYVVGTDTKETENPSIVNKPGSTTYGPFVVVEHRGGSVFLVLYSDSLKGSPFNRFFFPSFVNALVEYDGADDDKGCAQFVGIPDLYAGYQHNRDKVSIIGSSGIVSPKNSFSLTSFFTYEKSDGTSDVVNGVVPRHYLNFYGSFNLNDMSLSVSGATLSTSKCYFPFSCYYDVELHAYDENSTAIIYSNAQKAKILPGARLVIGKSVSVFCPGLVVYAKYDESKYTAGTGEDSDIQGKSGAFAYEKMGVDGTLIVDGSLTATELGGFIETRLSNAKISFTNNSVTAYEVKNGDSTYYPFELASSGYVDSDGALVSPLTAGSYISSGTHWVYRKSFSITISPSSENSSIVYTLEVGGKAYSGTNTFTIDGIEENTVFKIASIKNGYLPASSKYELNKEYSLTENVVIPIVERETLTSFNVVVDTSRDDYYDVSIILTFKDLGVDVYTNETAITKTTSLEDGILEKLTTGMTVRFKKDTNILTAYLQTTQIYADTDYLITDKDCTLTIKPNYPSCVISGTNITMADDSSKIVDDIKLGDIVRTWDFEIGAYSAEPVILIERSQDITGYFYLLLDNGTSLGVSFRQAFFDMDKRDYVSIYENNAESYIGRNIMVEGSGGPSSAKIIGIEHVEKAVAVYEIVTAYDYNFFADGIMTAPAPLIPDHTFFKVDGDLKYDPVAKKDDIAEYGLYRYEEYSDIFTEVMFDMM